MFPISAIQSGTKDRRTAILIGLVIAVLSVPVIVYAFGANPPLGYTGAPGQGTCASCHGTLTSGSGVTVNAPASYTPGGAAVPMTVVIPSTGGFELSILTQSSNAQVGTLAAGPPPAGAAFPQDAATTVGTIQYVYSTVETTSWNISWIPPATSAGNVVLYVTGGNHNTNYSNSYVIAGTPHPPTLGVSSTSLTFTVNGAEPAMQSVLVTSGGVPIAVTIATSTTPVGGSWLTVMPPGGNTPFSATVGIVATGLAAGTYTGSVSFASTGASNSPISVPVTLNVTTPIPTGPPTLNLSSTGLNFTATVGGTAPAAQSVMVSTSDGSAVTFTDSAATTSGGNWLSVDTGADSTPTSEPIAVTLPGLAAGTYIGTVTFTSSAVSNSQVTLPVTLTVNSQSPPVPSLQFCFVVDDRQSHGTEWILLDGTGSVNSSDQVTGGGFFTRFRTRAGGEGEGTTSFVVATGTWTATSVTSFTPVSGSNNGGTLVLQVKISTKGGSTTTGGLTISSTGTNTGVNLDIEEDSENHKDLHYVNVGINNKVLITKDE